eukprot:scaffold20040_cov76-Skeletonema_marinoi.AAC.1
MKKTQWLFTLTLACILCIANAFLAPPSTKYHLCSHIINHVPITSSSSSQLQSSRNGAEDIYGAVHRKEYEMKRLNAQHASLSDPIRMAMGYAQEGIEQKRLAAALRR